MVKILITVSNLSFEYDGKTVLHDVSFEVAENSVVALVGPNGAGKTTLMRCLSALHVPVSGRIKIDGIDALENPREVHRRTGYLSDFFGLYDGLTVRQSLAHMAGCQYIPSKEINARVDEVMKLTGLTSYADSLCSTLSRGYRQRVGVGLAIIHMPKVLILDEPASGMDPEARIALSELIRDLQAQGMTIIVSSHILAELEDYCTDMLVIRQGCVREHLVHEEHKKQEMLGILVKSTGDVKALEHYLNEHEHLSTVEREGENGFSFMVAGNEEQAASILQDMISQKLPVFSFEVKKKSLQKAYMDLAREDVDSEAPPDTKGKSKKKGRAKR